MGGNVRVVSLMPSCNITAALSLRPARMAPVALSWQMPTMPSKSAMAVATPAESMVAALSTGAESPPPPPQDATRATVPAATAPAPAKVNTLEPLNLRMMTLLGVCRQHASFALRDH